MSSMQDYLAAQLGAPPPASPAPPPVGIPPLQGALIADVGAPETEEDKLKRLEMERGLPQVSGYSREHDPLSMLRSSRVNAPQAGMMPPIAQTDPVPSEYPVPPTVPGITPPPSGFNPPPVQGTVPTAGPPPPGPILQPPRADSGLSGNLSQPLTPPVTPIAPLQPPIAGQGGIMDQAKKFWKNTMNQRSNIPIANGMARRRSEARQGPKPQNKPQPQTLSAPRIGQGSTTRGITNSSLSTNPSSLQRDSRGKSSDAY